MTYTGTMKHLCKFKQLLSLILLARLFAWARVLFFKTTPVSNLYSCEKVHVKMGMVAPWSEPYSTRRSKRRIMEHRTIHYTLLLRPGFSIGLRGSILSYHAEGHPLRPLAQRKWEAKTINEPVDAICFSPKLLSDKQVC